MFGILGDTKKKKKHAQVDVNPIEAIREFGSDFSDSIKDDLLGSGYEELIKQTLELKKEAHKMQGDLQHGEEMVLSGGHGDESEGEAEGHEAPKRHDIDPGLDYHREMRHFSERSTQMQSREVEAKLEQIITELEMLIDASSDLETQFEILAVEQKPVEPGEYHLTFFELMIGTIQQARRQIEDSSAWLGALQSKKGKKSYWSMFKKHGTSFGMSNERQVATQSG